MAKGAPIHRMTQPDAPLKDSANVLLVRLNEMLAWAESIHDPANVEELHNMRIAAKRFRYTVEIFAPVLGPDALAFLKTAEDIQEQLGLIHDCDVLFPLLMETLQEEMDREKRKALKSDGGPPPFMAAEGLAALISRKREERKQRYSDFITYWEKLPPESLVDRLAQLTSK